MAEIFYIVFESSTDFFLSFLTSLTLFTFKSSEMKYLKKLNCHGGSDPHNIFLLFMNRMVDFLVPQLEKIFLVLLLLVVLQKREERLI